jgi:hypothetical protein
MDEEELDSLLQSRPFTTKDAARADAQLRRRTALAIALWGRTVDDLRRQLLAPPPEIPSGFALNDFHELLRNIQNISDGFSNPRHAWLTRLPFFSQTISIGRRDFTAWEARCEIVRRAIEFLENH